MEVKVGQVWFAKRTKRNFLITNTERKVCILYADGMIAKINPRHFAIGKRYEYKGISIKPISSLFNDFEAVNSKEFNQ